MKTSLRHAMLSSLLLPSLAVANAECAPDPVSLSETVQTLASDDFAGRAPSSPQEPLVLDYITSAFREAGLSPAGDMKGTERLWTQEVSLVRSRTTGPVSVALNADGTREVWTQGEEVVIRPAPAGTSTVAIDNAPIVFMGYGVSAPERGWNDFKGVDLSGKIVLVLVNDPDFEAESGPFGGKAMTYYGRWIYKFEEAARQGALGVLIVHEEKAASYGWPIVRNSNMTEQFSIAQKTADNPTQLTGWIQHDVAAKLIAKAGYDLGTLKAQASSPGFVPVDLPDVKLDASFATSHRESKSHNVVGILPGSKTPAEYLIHSAHWDHMGQRQTSDGNVHIYNGALDNATGVAALIELAKCYGTGPRPDRSVVFLATTAEEQGLLGSSFYVANPSAPLSSTVGLINFDILGVYGPANNVSTFGHAANTLTDELKETAQRHGRYFSADPKPEAGHFYRSETLPFARTGVPSLTFSSGDDLLEGGRKAGQAQAAAYIAARYHQPADDWSPDMRFDGVASDLMLVYDMSYRLATSDRWPSWYKDSEFANVRR